MEPPGAAEPRSPLEPDQPLAPSDAVAPQDHAPLAASCKPRAGSFTTDFDLFLEKRYNRWGWLTYDFWMKRP